MEKENKTLTIAIVALLTSLSIGGGIALDDSTLDNYYICDVNFETGEFARLSGTQYTAYPNELDNKGYIRCTDGTLKGSWHQIEEYAKTNNLDINSLIPKDDENKIEDSQEEIIEKPVQTDQQSKNVAIKYTCDQKSCTIIGG